MPATDRDPTTFTPEDEADWARLDINTDGRILLNHFCNFWLGEQGQYIARHVHGLGEDYPGLATGLDYTGRNEYTYAFTPAAAREFITRLRRYRWAHHMRCR